MDYKKELISALAQRVYEFREKAVWEDDAAMKDYYLDQARRFEEVGNFIVKEC